MSIENEPTILANNDSTAIAKNDKNLPLFSVGTVLLDRFEIIKELGQGGMGVVYQVKDILLEQMIAIKTINKEYADNHDYMKRFKLEIALARTIESENVARIYDLHIDKESHTPFFTMKLYRAENTLGKNKLFLRQAKRGIFRTLIGIMNGLEAMHKINFLHRDIKPSNIIVLENYVPILIDFGLIKDLTINDKPIAQSYVVGTPGYMAPETEEYIEKIKRNENVKKDKPYSFQSDIFSAGIVFWEILTGKKLSKGVAQSPSSIRTNKVNSILDKIVMQMLEHDLKTRQASAGEVINQLNEAEMAYRKKQTDTPPPTKKVVAPKTRIRSSVGGIVKTDDMVLVGEGEFLSGPDKTPYFVDNYYIDKYLVTNKDYSLFLAANLEHPHPEDWDINKTKDDHPVVNVTFQDAKAYAKWKGKRLPTAKEWEKAARGIDGFEYPWGDEPDPKKCNVEESKVEGTTSVGLYEDGKSPYECHDMAGNVWEWIDEETIKGGSFANNIKDARCWYEEHRFNHGYKYLGFRCAKDADVK